MADRTTVTVQPGVRDELRAMKVGGETYTEVIKRMMKHYKHKEAHS